MPSAELENLVRTGQLKREPAATAEIQGLLASGEARLADARNPSLSLESRFDLAYNAAHALSLAALRLRGYRPRSVGSRRVFASAGFTEATLDDFVSELRRVAAEGEVSQVEDRRLDGSTLYPAS